MQLPNKCCQSPKVDKIYCAPGNAGIAVCRVCADRQRWSLTSSLHLQRRKPLILPSLVWMIRWLAVSSMSLRQRAAVFGPRKNAAILEGSKAFSKDLMKKYHIPTAAYENFTDPEEAEKYLETAKFPIVLKADGLALGKGCLICNTLEEAKEGVRTIMEDKKFGKCRKHDGNRGVYDGA